MNRPPKKNKPIKINGSFQKVLDLAFKEKPDGEDFFVFTILGDDPDSVTNDMAYSIMGSWETATQSVSAFMDMVHVMPFKPNQIAMRQGEKARNFLKNSMEHELKYQREREGQPNN